MKRFTFFYQLAIFVLLGSCSGSSDSSVISDTSTELHGVGSNESSGINTDSDYLGTWRKNGWNETMTITKNGKNFLIEDNILKGIYIKTNEDNLSGFNGFVLITYDKEKGQLIVNETTSTSPISYWDKVSNTELENIVEDAQ